MNDAASSALIHDPAATIATSLPVQREVYAPPSKPAPPPAVDDSREPANGSREAAGVSRDAVDGSRAATDDSRDAAGDARDAGDRSRDAAGVSREATNGSRDAAGDARDAVDGLPDPIESSEQIAGSNGAVVYPSTSDSAAGESAVSDATLVHPPHIQPRFFDKIEAFISKLSMRDNFWNGVCSLIWLPLAFFSGIRMKELDASTFAARAVLPFRRFNRNWYRAMAGGALLANSEIAGGSYVFGICGADYTVVCKNLNYTFLRPCFGPAVYRMTARQDIKQLLASRREFNVTIDMDITQQASRQGERDKRVGRCEATFHVTPKLHHKAKKARRRG